jgi:formylglycine-generating enzyme required for sulfatase activity
MKTYASWIGADLPTESEWEYVSRGTESRSFPWGESANSLCPGNIAQIRHASTGFSGCGLSQPETTAPVCTRTNGSTPEGVCDMAGNVSEWTLDAYYSDHSGAPVDGSARCPEEDCADGDMRTIKGGYYDDFADYTRGGFRSGAGTAGDATIGARVVRIPLGAF